MTWWAVVANGMEGEEVTYPSQLTYSSGMTMCTSVCYMLGCALISNYRLSVPPSQEQMSTTMEAASIIHRKLINDSGHDQHLFSVMEVKEAIGLPRGVVCKEVMGSVGPLPEDFIGSFEDGDDNACAVIDMGGFIRDQPRDSVVLITIHSHTTFLYRERSGAVWRFDPLVASFGRFEDARELLGRFHGSVYTGALFMRESPGRAA